MGIVCRLRVVVCWICHIIQELRCECCCGVIRRYDEAHSCVRSLVWSGVFTITPYTPNIYPSREPCNLADNNIAVAIRLVLW